MRRRRPPMETKFRIRPTTSRAMPTQRRNLREATSSPTMIRMMPRTITDFPSQTGLRRAWTALAGGAIGEPCTQPEARSASADRQVLSATECRPPAFPTVTGFRRTGAGGLRSGAALEHIVDGCDSVEQRESHETGQLIE